MHFKEDDFVGSKKSLLYFGSKDLWPKIECN
jgi:hypothetical protein